MPSFALKQPNGKYAIFSSVVDDFVFCDATYDEALEELKFERGQDEALKMLQSAVDDRPIRGELRCGNGLGRWKSALKTIGFRHGMDGLASSLAEAGMSDYEIPSDVVAYVNKCWDEMRR